MADLSPTPGKGSTLPNAPTTQEEHPHDKYSLKGTFACVLLLAALIVASWYAVFALFLSRQ
ncbi:cytochrome c oxidase subunit 2A [Fodinisporobacter ferrooxydans]|uniref:Cytochrome c oxidase subunit 2A n=1 Tax=Fodinisporobacter ferrooxydans TaxID=2901836 RepID=A0ABY4CNK7_9BACL|nr:cytochrome c oxidase subunit 2A [Alicyclobacillaceae bacterium MYW30-H2]